MKRLVLVSELRRHWCNQTQVWAGQGGPYAFVAFVARSVEVRRTQAVEGDRQVLADCQVVEEDSCLLVEIVAVRREGEGFHSQARQAGRGMVEANNPWEDTSQRQLGMERMAQHRAANMPGKRGLRSAVDKGQRREPGRLHRVGDM